MSWAPEYATVEQLRAFVRVGDDLDDDQMSLAIASASRAIDTAAGRQFGATAAPEVRYFPGTYDQPCRRWVVEIDDLMVTPVAVTSDGTVTTGYTLLERNAPAKGRPWTSMALSSSPGWDDVAVEATWGWTAVPDVVVEATLLQASRFLARRDSPYGVTGSPDNGGELRLLARVDPDVETVIRSVRRSWWAA